MAAPIADIHAQDPDPRLRRAVHAADRAPRARDAASTARSIPTTSTTTFVREFAPKGIILSGGHDVGLRGATRRARRRRCSSSACRCSASATACRPWRSSSAARSRPARVREFGYAEVRARGHTRLLDGIEDFAHRRGPRHAQGLDEPRRQGHRAAAGLQADGVARRAARSPAWPTRRARFYGVQFHPEVTHTLQGTAILRALRARDLRLRGPTGACRDYVAEAVARIREQVGNDEVHPRPVGRRRFVGRRGADPRAIGDQLTCVFVDHGLLRLNEGEQVMDTFAQHLRREGDPRRRRATSSSARSRASTDPEAKRKIIGRVFVEVFQREAAKLDEREVARAGHDLPGRDRVGRRQDQEGAHHQVAPQRRRPARDAAPEAARAAARAVQGRGARARRRARPAARDGVSAIRSRARAWACASSAR